MNVKEFSDQFDILYNSIATNSAPSIDLYEKSVFLTKAQLELVKDYFNPDGNKYRRGFEGNSKRRVDLKQLVKPYASNLKISTSGGISSDSQFFIIPKDTYLIVQETAKVTSSDSCINNTYLDVIPKTHDEYNTQKKNPFKKPNQKTVWRLDVGDIQPGNKNIELISPYNITEYKFRYVAYPSPIILTDLAATFPGESLTIDGITTSQTSKLDQSIHPEILDRAVELALAAYKPEGLQAKVQLDQRNE